MHRGSGERYDGVKGSSRMNVWQLLVPPQSARVSLALVVLRIVVGASFVFHGAPKLAHPMSWDTGHGPLPGVPAWLQFVVVAAEVIGGWCVIFGFLTPLFAFLQTCDMIVVVFVVEILRRGLPYVGPAGRSYEVEAHLLAGALAILLCGPGTFSIDALLKKLIDRGNARRSGSVNL
jgi:putative oxidoreductase